MKNVFISLIILSIVILIASLIFFRWTRINKHKTGTIIILNGPSSVGKTTIQNKIQELFPDPYLRMGLDDLAFLPEKYISIIGPVPPADKGIYLVTKEIDGHPVIYIHYGEVGQKMIKGIHRTFAAFASTDNNIVVDYLLYDRAWLDDLKSVLKDFRVYFIGINAPLEIIEEREKQRGNRLLGHARSHYDTIHKDLIYDLEIDSSKVTPEEAALSIKKYIHQNPQPTAFRKN